MQNEPQYSLANFSPEEGKLVLGEVEAVLKKYSGHFVVKPVINVNGTLGAAVEIFKKVELVPKEKEGILSPLNGDSTDNQGGVTQKT